MLFDGTSSKRRMGMTEDAILYFRNLHARICFMREQEREAAGQDSLNSLTGQFAKLHSYLMATGPEGEEIRHESSILYNKIVEASAEMLIERKGTYPLSSLHNIAESMYGNTPDLDRLMIHLSGFVAGKLAEKAKEYRDLANSKPHADLSRGS